MKNIIKIGKFEFMILVIVAEGNPRLKDINKNLNKRYKKLSKGYLSKVMKKLRNAGLVMLDNSHYELTKNGEYYVELYNKLGEV